MGEKFRDAVSSCEIAHTVSIYSPFGAAFLAVGRDMFSKRARVCTQVAIRGKG
jgi:hypothetical protein